MPAVPNLRRAGLNALVERQVDRVAAAGESPSISYTENPSLNDLPADATPADDSNVVVNPKNRQRPMSVESTVITINEPTVMTIIPTVVITQTVTATVEDIETTSPTEPASTRTKTRTRTRTRTRTTETESQELSTSTIVLSTSYVVQETTDALSTSTILPSPTATSEVFDGSAPTGVKVISPGDEVTTTVQDSSVEAPQASETSAAVESTLAETVMEPMPTATSSIEDLSIETALLASSTAPEISGDANATASSELSGTAGTAGATAQPSISISYVPNRSLAVRGADIRMLQICCGRALVVDHYDRIAHAKRSSPIFRDRLWRTIYAYSCGRDFTYLERIASQHFVSSERVRAVSCRNVCSVSAA